MPGPLVRQFHVRLFQSTRHAAGHESTLLEARTTISPTTIAVRKKTLIAKSTSRPRSSMIGPVTIGVLGLSSMSSSSSSMFFTTTTFVSMLTDCRCVALPLVRVGYELSDEISPSRRRSVIIAGAAATAARSRIYANADWCQNNDVC